MKEEKLVWTNLDKNSGIEVFGGLGEALKSKNIDEVQKILQNPEVLRALILNRGRGNKNMNMLEDGFAMLLEVRYGKSDIFELNDEDIINLVHEVGLPEQILAELTDAAYHKRSEEKKEEGKIRFLRLVSVILENEELIQNKEVVNRVFHNWAAWKKEIENDKEGALSLNKQVLSLSNDDILLLKAKMGLVVHKDLKQKEKAEDYQTIGDKMTEKNHLYDAKRARLEEAKARLVIAKNISTKARSRSEFHDQTAEIERLLKDALEYASKHEYLNLEVQALETYSLLLDLIGEKQKAGISRKQAEKRRKSVGYVTQY
jgi:hypothetical protein